MTNPDLDSNQACEGDYQAEGRYKEGVSEKSRRLVPPTMEDSTLKSTLKGQIRKVMVSLLSHHKDF
jgi:hypothetical protein